MPKPNICCIFNYAPHYRAPIYTLMDKELNCDFYFGDSVGTEIKEMDVSSLKGFKSKLARKKVSRWNYFWLSNSIEPIFKNYTHYIVSGDSKYLSIWLLLIVSKLFNKKVFLWGHGMKGNKSYFQTKIDFVFYSLCSKVLLYGTHAKNTMLKLGFKEDKLELIYNSLEYEKHITYRGKLKNNTLYQNYFNNDNPVLLYIGRLQKSKKLELLIDLVKQLKDQHIDVNLVFIGKNIDNNTIDLKIKDSNLERNIWLYGPCYNEEKIADLIQQASLCISPGPIGLTAIHVATYGIPIITNNDFNNQMPEFEVIKAGVNGDFYCNNNFTSLFQITKQWLSIDENKKREAIKYSQFIIDSLYTPKSQLILLQKLINS